MYRSKAFSEVHRPLRRNSAKILNAEVTQFMETVIEELCDPWMSLTIKYSSNTATAPSYRCLHQNVSNRAFRSRMFFDITCRIQQFVSPVVWWRSHRQGEPRRRAEPTRNNEDGIGAGPVRCLISLMLCVVVASTMFNLCRVQSLLSPLPTQG